MGDGRTENQKVDEQEITSSWKPLPLLWLVGQREKVVLLESKSIAQLEESRTMASLTKNRTIEEK